jgi:hypothetical protein
MTQLSPQMTGLLCRTHKGARQRFREAVNDALNTSWFIPIPTQGKVKDVGEALVTGGKLLKLGKKALVSEAETITSTVAESFEDGSHYVLRFSIKTTRLMGAYIENIGLEPVKEPKGPPTLNAIAFEVEAGHSSFGDAPKVNCRFFFPRMNRTRTY